MTRPSHPGGIVKVSLPVPRRHPAAERRTFRFDGVGRVGISRQEIVDADDAALRWLGLLPLLCFPPRSSRDGVDLPLHLPLPLLLLALAPHLRAPQLSLGFVDRAVEIEIEAPQQLTTAERSGRR
jgi:hypothetical protein